MMPINSIVTLQGICHREEAASWKAELRRKEYDDIFIKKVTK
ncbi:MAG: hypothetical protein U0X39_15655 [Bacteroidales bacterium]